MAIKVHAPLVTCPNCGKSVKAWFSTRTEDGTKMLVYRHRDRQRQPCPQAEVDPPPIQ